MNPTHTANDREAGRFREKRPASRVSALALSVLATLASASCSTTVVTRLLLPDRHAPSATVPSLTLAGRAASGCDNARLSALATHGFEITELSYFDEAGNMPSGAYQREGVGHAVVHYFACHRYTAEIAVVVAGGDTGDPLRPELWQVANLFEPLMPGPGDRITALAIVTALRIDPHEPFVYGAQRFISEHEALQLRFDPTQNDTRLMFVYRLGL